MLIFLFAILYYFTVFLCQLFNNVTPFPNALIVPIGLFIYSPAIHLRPIQAIILCVATGLLFDATFWFLPFGFSVIFCLFFHCALGLIGSATASGEDRRRRTFEQFANISYVFFLFALGSAPFPVGKFLLTAALSQTVAFLVSGPMARAHAAIASVCDNYARYRR